MKLKLRSDFHKINLILWTHFCVTHSSNTLCNGCFEILYISVTHCFHLFRSTKVLHFHSDPKIQTSDSGTCLAN